MFRKIRQFLDINMCPHNYCIDSKENNKEELINFNDIEMAKKTLGFLNTGGKEKDILSFLKEEIYEKDEDYKFYYINFEDFFENHVNGYNKKILGGLND